MSIEIFPHLNFRGEARKALEFYQTVFGGELTIVSYGDARSSQDPAEAKQVMWGQVATENGFKLMVFDALPARLPFERGRTRSTSPRGLLLTTRRSSAGEN